MGVSQSTPAGKPPRSGHQAAIRLRYEGSVPTDSPTGGVIGDVAEPLPPPAFSYASDEVGRIGQRIIRGIEKITGQPRIRRLYENYTKL